MAGVKITEKLYLNEYGFYIDATTNLDLSSLTLGDVKMIIIRPDATELKRDIAQVDWIDTATGQVRAQIISGDLNQLGSYTLQIVIRDVANGILRPSHIGKFTVVDPITDLTAVFA